MRLRYLAAPIAALTALAGLSAVTPLIASAQTVSDYHLEAFGDPMDFSNQEDAILNTTEAMMLGTSNRSISDGQLHFDSAGIFRFDPVWPGYATGIPHGREGGRVPIDTNRFKRIIIRMNAPEGAPLGLRWYSCLEQNGGCTGGQAFAGRGGWNTYDIPIGVGTDPSLPVSWSGSMLGFSIVGNAAGHFDIDYVRFVSADTVDINEIAGGAPGGPAPTDKLDYATAAGNPWDMDSAADVTVVNMAPGWSVANGRFSGCSLGTATGKFPQVFFNLPGGKAIDANRFKTFTFEYSYQGTFNSRPVPGGGSFGRVFWYDAGGGRHPTSAIHTYPNERAVQVRLDSPRAVFQGIEAGKGQTGRPWAGTVSKFSLMFPDDKAARCFTIGRAWLTADEPAGAPLGDSPTVAPTPTAATKAPATSSKTTKKRVVRTTRKRR